MARKRYDCDIIHVMAKAKDLPNQPGLDISKPIRRIEIISGPYSPIQEGHLKGLAAQMARHLFNPSLPMPNDVEINDHSSEAQFAVSQICLCLGCMNSSEDQICVETRYHRWDENFVDDIQSVELKDKDGKLVLDRLGLYRGREEEPPLYPITWIQDDSVKDEESSGTLVTVNIINKHAKLPNGAISVIRVTGLAVHARQNSGRLGFLLSGFGDRDAELQPSEVHFDFIQEVTSPIMIEAHQQ